MQVRAQHRARATRGLSTWTPACLKIKGPRVTFWNNFFVRVFPRGYRVDPHPLVFPRIELTEKKNDPYYLQEAVLDI